MVAQVSKPKTEIQQAVVFRCTDKTSGEIFYAVKSDSSDQMYKVTFNEVTRRYEDTCPATCECKHIRAVREVAKAKAESKQQVEKPAVASEDETVEVMVGNTKIVAARRNIDNAVSHHQWGIDVVAAVEGGKSEARYFEQKRALDEQYSAAPSAWELSETAASNMRAFYNGL